MQMHPEISLRCQRIGVPSIMPTAAYQRASIPRSLCTSIGDDGDKSMRFAEFRLSTV